MKLILTNDDGIEAPGLEALEKASIAYGEVTVVAPDRQHSGSGHRVTEGGPISIDSPDVRKYAIGGTPADCSRIGLAHLVPDADWVLSGINSGGNLGCDVFMSGTVAAVREATLMGRKAIAFSQYRHGMSSPFDWATSSAWVGRVLDRLFSESLKPGEFWNVNFPDPGEIDSEPELVFCPVDVQHYRLECEPGTAGVEYRSVYQERPRTPGRDIDVCFGGNISISKLTVCSNAPGMSQ
jgi:5'-nucleotidase